MHEHLLVHIVCDEWKEYELLDSGNRQKLERFGKYLLIRDEPRAWWRPELPESEWKKAVAYHAVDEFSSWVFHVKNLPHEWMLRYENLTLQARFPTSSKHVGVFPEKLPHWQWMRDVIRRSGRRDLNVLNMFAYTGVASLVAAAEGCRVTHVDSAKGVVTWAKENQRLSGLENRPIRWIVDDAFKFVQREGRRGNKYDAILFDPPSFGRGPKGEIWKLEEQLAEMLDGCRQILSDQPVLILITLYSIEQSAMLIGNVLQDMMQGFRGQITVGELALKPKNSEKRLSLSIFGQWEAE